MQKLFGRALEARGSCNCAICSPIGPGLARNANNTLPAKRRLKFSDVVNVVYGTIIGTAALYDGTVKNNRRRAVDNALLGLLQENEATIQNQEARLRALGYEGSESEATLSEDVARRYSEANLLSWNTIVKRPSILKPASLHLRHYSIRYLNHEERCERNREGWWQVEMQARQKERILDRLQQSSRSAEYMGSAQHHIQNKRIPNLLSTPQPEARFTGKTIEDAWEDLTLIPNERNWQIRETAVAQLVLKLLKTYLTGIDTAREKPPTISLKNINGLVSEFSLEDIPRITRLHNDLARRMENLRLEQEVPNLAELIDQLPFPRFTNYRRHEGVESFYHSDVRDLNDEITSIFVQATNSADLVSGLCTLLVSCPIGPDIHTMNLLLILFLDIQWYQACKAVIHAISTMAMNQNEVTDVAKLQFYHLTQQGTNLDIQRACMLGLDGRVTRAAFEIGAWSTQTYQPEQVVVKLKSRGDVQSLTHGLKAGWTAEAFSVVIVDLLDRGELQEALAEIATMQISGFQETSDVLEALLQYSVFKQDWNLATKTWARFDDLDYTKPLLTWYWMLQACASCKEIDKFHQLAAAGQQQGILDRSIEYTLESFDLTPSEQTRLKLRVYALRRFRHRISIPRLLQRDLLIPEDEIVQMPNLQDTALMVYLQHAKLRNITYPWFVDHLDYLCEAETQFEHVVRVRSATPQLLQRIKAKWTIYNARLEAFESKHHGSSNIRDTEYAAVRNGFSTITQTRSASTQELLESIGYHRITARPINVALESRTELNIQQANFKDSWSLQTNSTNDTVEAVPKRVLEHRWHQTRRHEIATESRTVPIRYTTSTPSVTLRKVFAKRNSYRAVELESSTHKDDLANAEPPATKNDVILQLPLEYVVPRPVSAPPRIYEQHDIEPDEVFGQDLRLVAAAC